jgi:transcriptional/translational regulatory protein YebC/TACO1
MQIYKEIVAAVKTGGSKDPKENPRLFQAMEKARLESVPKVACTFRSTSQ